MPFKIKHRNAEGAKDEENHLVVLGGMRIFLVLILVVGALLFGGGTLIYHIEREDFLERIRFSERSAIALQSSAIDRELDRIVADILYLSKQNELTLHLDTGDRKAIRDMGREYEQLAKNRPNYDQIRYIDAKGVERVRVNHRGGQSRIVPPAELQDKSDRYYFKGCIPLARGDIYLSPLDLNAEDGVIERPFRPVLRIGTPVFDTSGRKRGIILINYNAQALLDRIHRASYPAEGGCMLINCQGYWILNPDKSKEWGFMWPEMRDVRFDKELPLEWKRMLDEEHGQFRTGRGLFTFSVERPLTQMQAFSLHLHDPTETAFEARHESPRFWVLVSLVPPAILDEQAHSLLFKLLMSGGLLFALMTFGAWHLALAISRRQLYQEQLEAAALFDALTGLPNRKLFFDRLEAALTLNARHERRLALLYIDLDGFKSVNDTMGHDAGDELLKQVGTLLSGTVRQSDTVSRLGGDEFAVLLHEVANVEAAALVGEKIVSVLHEPIQLKAGSTTIGASVGVAVYPEHGDSAETLIRNADQAMYVSKSKGKNTCTMAGSPRHANA